MCGIVSILSPKGVERGAIDNALASMRHRGPDGTGTWFSNDSTVALGHARLSIIDVEHGRQPLFNERGDIAAVVNGEFYDFERIRAELRRKGHVFATGSDSEILLHLYEEHGAECLWHLRGEFAFVLWDVRENTLFAARDRFGIKPLNYARIGDDLYIASESKALFAAGLEAAWDEYAWYHCASLQYQPCDRTLFDGVKQLPPGHCLVHKDGYTNVFCYWDLDYPKEPQPIGKAEAVEEFGRLLTESIRLRMRSDVPVCAHLSGGLDSSTITALMADMSDEPLDCFSVSFEAEGYDEFRIAQETAKHCGARFNPVHVTQEQLVHELPDAVWYSEGLAINGHLAAKYLLSKAIREAGYKVALTGEGSDEVLAGYPHLREDLFRMQAANDGAGAMVEKLYATNEASAGLQLAHGDMLPTGAVEQALGYVPSFLEAKASLGLRLHGVLAEDYKQRFEKKDCYADLMAATDFPRQMTGRHPVNQSSYLWTKLALAQYILRTLADGTEMASSIEGRLPFLDHKLFEYARHLPMDLKIRDGVEKYILREAVKPHLTETVYKRQKHPFLAPPVSVFSNDALNEYVRDSVNSAAFATLPFFDKAKITAMLDALPDQDRRARTAAEPVLMLVLTTFVMHKRFGL